jgi:hypothetical protein
MERGSGRVPRNAARLAGLRDRVLLQYRLLMLFLLKDAQPHCQHNLC